MTATRRTLFGLIAAPAVIALPASAEALALGHPDAGLLELERQRVIAEATHDRLAALADASGASGDSDLSEAATCVLGDLEDRILTTPARTSAGLGIKARMAARIMGEADGTREDFAARSVVADLLAG